jgi:phosphate transport system permease protein
MTASHDVAGRDTGRPRPTRHAPRTSGSGGRLIRAVGGIAAVIPLLALAFIVVTLLLEAIPAIQLNGWSFFSSTAWNPGNLYSDGVTDSGVQHPPGSSYGALPLIVGTLESSLIALIVGVPIAVGAALAVVERLPRGWVTAVGFVLELLAGIPSVVIGLWGALTFGPILADDVAPLIARNVPRVPVLGFLTGPTGNGEGLLTSGLVLAVMIIPIVAATTRDLLSQVPILPKEGARALGLSHWEVTRKVTLPWIRSGLIGAIVLGLGRALGETMAVAMVSGAVLGSVPANLYSTMTTIAATIVSQLDSALTDSTGFAVETLAEAALVLALITLAVNIGARWLVTRGSGATLPVGRGV